jgi:hypothetical protein
MTILPLNKAPVQPIILPRHYAQKLYSNQIITGEEYKALEDGKAVFIARMAWCVMPIEIDYTHST